MQRFTAALAAAALSALAGCAGAPASEDYWVEGNGPVLVRGSEPEGTTDILEAPGVLRYDPDSGCFLLESNEPDGGSTMKTVVWHMEAVAAVDGDRYGVTVIDETGAEVTLWDGDLLAGTFTVPSKELDSLGACEADAAISVLRVSSLSQSQLQDEAQSR
jgi:hypothetical protein